MRNGSAINGRPHKVAIEKPSVIVFPAMAKRMRRIKKEKIPMMITPPTMASVPGFFDAKMNSWDMAPV